ncbi:hypothetical protein TNCV_350871 [Trichonephila clavipes]|nr:hypothetical protein TNCV_350871 [Trichonephila clavipes]
MPAELQHDLYAFVIRSHTYKKKKLAWLMPNPRTSTNRKELLRRQKFGISNKKVSLRIIIGLRRSYPREIVLFEADLKPLRTRRRANLTNFNKLSSYGQLLPQPGEGNPKVHFHFDLSTPVIKGDLIPNHLRLLALEIINGIPSDVFKIYTNGSTLSDCAATRGLLATDLVILNHGQVTRTTPKLEPPLLSSTSMEDVWASTDLRGCGSPVVKVSNHGRHVMSSIPVPLKTRRVGQRCTLNLSRAETSSR